MSKSDQEKKAHDAMCEKVKRQAEICGRLPTDSEIRKHVTEIAERVEQKKLHKIYKDK